MTWKLTLEVVDCTATSTFLDDAEVSKGAEVLGTTNAQGKFGPIEFSDTETFVILRVKKATFLDGSGSYNKDAHDGTTQTLCLQPSPYGSDDPTQPGQPGQPLTPDGPCFIVTATTGSPHSDAVVRLRALRERVRTASKLGDRLIDAIYSEYEQFSPRIAGEIERGAVPRELVLQAVVRPLLAWYRLAGVLAFADPGRESATQELRDACPPELAGVILPILQTLRRGGDGPMHGRSALSRLEAELATFEFVPWAILDPLVQAWQASRGQLDLDADRDVDLAQAVARWMAAAPLERLAPSMRRPPSAAELAVLSSFFDFEPSARRQFGERLRMAWPAAETALEHAGF